MSHKAFLFDWNRFQQELAALLGSCLESDDPASLVAYANDHLDDLKDPYEGEPLDENWAEQMENGDIQEVADYVLQSSMIRLLTPDWAIFGCKLRMS